MVERAGASYDTPFLRLNALVHDSREKLGDETACMTVKMLECVNNVRCAEDEQKHVSFEFGESMNSSPHR